MAGPKTKSPGAGTVKPASDPSYNLVSIMYHALKGADLYNQYIADAEAAGDNELRDFFTVVRDEDTRRAQQARHLLVSRSQLETTADWKVEAGGPSVISSKPSDIVPEAE